MCGIVVGLTFGNKLSKTDEAIRQKLLRYFTTELIILTEERGKDATGAVVLFSDGRYAGLKRGDKSTEWLARFSDTKDFWGGFMKVWRENEVPGKVVLGHCRQGTHGDKEDNANNHPIKVGNIIGIHNGQIRNHDIIFENLGCKRDGKVDSEAVFRMFDHFTNGGKEPFTMDMCQEVVRRIDGEFAVVAFNADNPDQVPIFRDRRPAYFVLLRRYGILLIVSESKFWTQAHFQYERMIGYNPDLFGTKKMPSFLDKGEVESKELQDDHCMLFDLTKVVTMDTKIDDLGELKRMERQSKIWDTRIIKPAYTRSAATYSTGASTPNVGARTTKTSTTATSGSNIPDDQKRRVWDKVTKRYKIKVGDLIIDENDELVLETIEGEVVDDKKDDKKDDKSTSVVLVDEDDQDVVASISAEPTGAEEEPEEKATTTTPAVEDATDYSTDAKSGSEDSDGTVFETTGKVVEVNLKKIPAEVLEAARTAYDAIPVQNKGFDNMEDMLTQLNIESEVKAKDLGPLLVANRASSLAWKQGYAACVMDLMQDPKESKLPVTKRREKHIAALKAMVIIMAKTLSELKSGSKTVSDLTQTKLANVALAHQVKVNPLDFFPLFNEHERKIVAEVGSIITKADDYK